MRPSRIICEGFFISCRSVLTDEAWKVLSRFYRIVFKFFGYIPHASLMGLSRLGKAGVGRLLFEVGQAIKRSALNSRYGYSGLAGRGDAWPYFSSLLGSRSMYISFMFTVTWAFCLISSFSGTVWAFG